MRAIVTDGESNVWDEERPRPEPGPEEALVDVRAVGICGSDVGLIHGEGPPWTEYPLVPGHEVCAEVVDVGSAVEDLAAGDRVVLHGFVSCGACGPCREGRYYQCDHLREIGFTIDGGYREYAAFPAETLTPIPDGVSDREATQIDPAACTLHGLRRVDASIGDTAAVFGAGSLGLYGVQLLRERGVDDVILVDVLDERLDVGRDLGASLTVNGRETDPVAAIRDYTDGRGVDLAVEAAGAADAVGDCLRATTERGSVVLLGVFGSLAEIDPDLIVSKELSVAGGVTAAHAVDDVVDLFRRNVLSAEGVVTHEFGLREYREALATVRERRDGVIKAVLRP